jgi:threonyl-tRNA synthetase
MNFTNEQALEKKRHSLAHILAMVVLSRFPDAKLAIGPSIDTGFYYDFDLKDSAPSQNDLLEIERDIKKIIKKKIEFKCKSVTEKEARVLFKDQPYKLEIVNDIVDLGKQLTVYESDSFTDLCEGPHVHDTGEIDPEGFMIERVAGAYWRGDEKNKMLTRIYGLAFNNKTELLSYLKQQEEAAARDHRRIGKELGLFVFSDVVGKGLPLWTDKGATIRREIEQFILEEEIKRGYKHVITPDIAKLDLYKKSGHYPYYKDSMYSPIKIDDEEFMLRPMTCPHHFELYLSRPRSYKELPMRIAEIAKLYRYEQSGELTGLIRVRSFCLADAHIICSSREQASKEIDGALDLIEYVSSVFGLKFGTDYWYRLSLGDRSDDKKYFKDDDAWDKAEDILRSSLQKRGSGFIEAPAEAAFYGPKVDIQMRNVRGKEDTAFTVQYDFVMPKRFNLTFIDEHGKEVESVVIHRSSVGAIERIVAFLIEHFAGKFPLWLSPVQIRILPVSAKHAGYAKEVAQIFRDAGIRTEQDEGNESLGKRIREAKLEKIPYLAVIGEKEMESKKITLESRKESLGQVPLDEALSLLKNEIDEKLLP